MTTATRVCRVCGESCGGPGKFEGNECQQLASAVNKMTCEGAHDDELGESESFGWYGLVVPGDDSLLYPAFIVCEDSQGFVAVESFFTETDARAKWARIEAAYYEKAQEG